MGKTAVLSDRAIELLGKTMDAVTATLTDETATPKERVESMKVGIAAVNQVLDRTEPRLSASHEMKTDLNALVKQLAANMPPEQAAQVLSAVQGRFMLPERVSNAGRPPLED